MLLAVTETAINNQFKDVSLKTHDLPDSWGLPEKPHEGEKDYEAKKKEYDDAGWHFIVEKFSAPQVDFNTNVKQGCRLIMGIEKGEMSSWTIKMQGGKPIPKQLIIPLDGLKLYVITPMRQLVHPTWSDEQFQVQALFADLSNLQNVDLDSTAMSTDIKAKIGGPTESSIQTLVADKLKDVGKKNKTALMFGAVKIPVIPESQRTVGPMAPKAAKYSVHKQLDQNGHYLTGSLNYLLWLDDPNQMPTGEAVGVFNEGWVELGQDAELVVSESYYLSHFLVPALREQYKGINFDIEDGSATAGIGATATLTGGGCEFKIDGLDHCFYDKFNIDIKSNIVKIDYSYTFRHKSIGTWDHYRATGTSKIIVEWKNGKLVSTIQTPQPKVESTDSGVRNWFKEFGEGMLIGFSLGAAAKAILNADDGVYDNAKGAADMVKSVQTVPTLCMLPGKAVFHYTQGKLDGQLRFNCSYKKVG
jgi:hypothetical protein